MEKSADFRGPFDLPGTSLFRDFVAGVVRRYCLDAPGAVRRAKASGRGWLCSAQGRGGAGCKHQPKLNRTKVECGEAWTRMRGGRRSTSKVVGSFTQLARLTWRRRGTRLQRTPLTSA